MTQKQTDSHTQDSLPHDKAEVARCIWSQVRFLQKTCKTLLYETGQ